jgi:hypothetical protein
VSNSQIIKNPGLLYFVGLPGFLGTGIVKLKLKLILKEAPEMENYGPGSPEFEFGNHKMTRRKGFTVIWIADERGVVDIPQFLSEFPGVDWTAVQSAQEGWEKFADSAITFRFSINQGENSDFMARIELLDGMAGSVMLMRTMPNGHSLRGLLECKILEYPYCSLRYGRRVSQTCWVKWNLSLLRFEKYRYSVENVCSKASRQRPE